LIQINLASGARHLAQCALPPPAAPDIATMFALDQKSAAVGE
jgi:hypothetical protein